MSEELVTRCSNILLSSKIRSSCQRGREIQSLNSEGLKIFHISLSWNFGSLSCKTVLRSSTEKGTQISESYAIYSRVLLVHARVACVLFQ